MMNEKIQIQEAKNDFYVPSHRKHTFYINYIKQHAPEQQDLSMEDESWPHALHVTIENNMPQ